MGGKEIVWSIYNPACDTGGMLVIAKEHIKEHIKENKSDILDLDAETEGLLHEVLEA